MSPAYSGGDPTADIFGISHDRKQVDKSLQGLWPPGTFPALAGKQAPGGQEQPSRSLIHDAPSTPGGRRPAPRRVKPKKRRAKKAA